MKTNLGCQSLGRVKIKGFLLVFNEEWLYCINKSKKL
jgi:hypothetical protein